jgi:hypothetical protein
MKSRTRTPAPPLSLFLGKPADAWSDLQDKRPLDEGEVGCAISAATDRRISMRYKLGGQSQLGVSGRV